jgi:hypothetical protein
LNQERKRPIKVFGSLLPLERISKNYFIPLKKNILISGDKPPFQYGFCIILPGLYNAPNIMTAKSRTTCFVGVQPGIDEPRMGLPHIVMSLTASCMGAS